MIEKPFISIVMPVYNAQEYIDEMIQSIKEQTFEDYELIMVNDCSTDQSAHLCEQYAKADNRIKVVHLEENKGAGNARNEGIKRAEGQYLSFMDSDDYIEKNLLEEAVTSIEESPADMVVYGLTEDYYDQKQTLISSNVLTLSQQYCKTTQQVRQAVITLEEKTLFGYQWNRLYRLSMIKENGIWFENARLYEDYFFNMQVIVYVKHMNILDCSKYHYKKRMNQSLTGQFVEEYFELSRRRVNDMFLLYKQWNLYDGHVQDILGNIYLRYILSALSRNCDLNANMMHRSRIQFVNKVIGDQLYENVSAACHTNSRVLRVLQKGLNNQSKRFCLCLGRGIYLVKEKFPMFFSMKKQK